MKILVINGPNLNLLGKRDAKFYGNVTLDKINDQLGKLAESEKADLLFFQSNHEGEIIDFIQQNSSVGDGILINPGALTHYGYYLRDAIVDANLPTVEVHLSNIDTREEFRKVNVFDGVVKLIVMGKKELSYIEGLQFLINLLKQHES